jgi:hypothetical protein
MFSGLRCWGRATGCISAMFFAEHKRIGEYFRSFCRRMSPTIARMAGVRLYMIVSQPTVSNRSTHAELDSLGEIIMTV